MIVLQSENGDQLDLRHLGITAEKMLFSQTAEGNFIELSGETEGHHAFQESALTLMMNPGFSAGDQVTWVEQDLLYTILRWEYRPLVDKQRRGPSGATESERVPHRWTLWLREEEVERSAGRRSKLPLGFQTGTVG